MTLFVRSTSFGTIVALAILDTLVDDWLPQKERAYAATLSPLRRRTWVAGRLALRSALSAIGEQAPAVLADERGAPSMREGLLASIAHKESVAVAIVKPDDGAGWRIGVDVEHDRPSRVDISRRILTPREIAARDARPPRERAHVVPISFSLKEAIYKAIDPVCRRYVGFHEVELELPDGELASGEPGVRMTLQPDPGRFAIEAAWFGELGLGGEALIVSMAMARRLA